MINITVIQGVQGSGKSLKMRNDAVVSRGLYMFACPSIELIEEQAEWLRLNACHVKVFEAHSKSKGRMSVWAKIQHAKDQIDRSHVDHAIIFITHEALMTYEFRDFKGYHIRIDEAPASIQSGVISAKKSRDFIQEKLELVVQDGDWSHYRLKDPIQWTDAQRDTFASQATEFFKQAGRPAGIFINEKQLADREEFAWFSFWSPSSLKALASVHIASSSYMTSLGYKGTTRFFPNDCSFIPNQIVSKRTAQPTIEIIWFTEAHHGSTSFWKRSNGRKCLVEIERYLAWNENDLGFWSGNDDVYNSLEHRISGEYISPKAKGLNKFRDKASCAFIYSSKATLGDVVQLEAFGLTSDDILLDRETEDIKQFVMRGAIRNSDYGGGYKVYLYEKSQAERLANHLQNSGFLTVSILQATTSFVGQYNRKPVAQSATTAPAQGAAASVKQLADWARYKRDQRARDAIKIANGQMPKPDRSKKKP